MTLYKEMGSDYDLPAGYSEHNLGLSLDNRHYEISDNNMDGVIVTVPLNSSY
ncbi:MAG TPA: hypothetical protein VGI33_10660 [Paenibacillus sp.]